MPNHTLFRGTTGPWEQAVIEGHLPQGSILQGNYMQRAAQVDPNFEQNMRNRITQIPCSVLKSGKEIVLGSIPRPLSTLTKREIEQEIINRVGHETALGTENLQSHFVPCGTNRQISLGFGNGTCYQFNIEGKIYARRGGVDEYISDRDNDRLPSYAVPLFEGGNSEVLAYTGSIITSVQLIDGGGVIATIEHSLD